MSKLQADLIPGAALDPERWDDFIRQSPQGCLYHLHAYATLVEPGWQAIVVQQGDAWQAVFPYKPKQKWGVSTVLQPLFAQYWGLCFAPPQPGELREYLALKRRAADAVLKVLGEPDLLVMNFSPEFDYGLPFHWAGCELRTRYTYRLDLRPPEEVLFHQLAQPLRRQIRKTQRAELSLSLSAGAESLEALCGLNRKRGRDLFGGQLQAAHLLGPLARLLAEKGWGELLEVRGPGGELYAAGLFGHYLHKTFYLQGSFHPDFADSGAMSRLMWEGIRMARQRGDTCFDFEGSMIESIEDFFRKFGAFPVPYLQIHRNRLPLWVKWIRGFTS